ncbi:protein toll-like [Copidosoma floridanum]|uniref:protein toll-like n=1 Tax=Copidosoma floridanum TaxID=29053 RepID=UPI0006C965EA|nr:protein toll-like [Copidosoma floridanum]XP_014204486.1 protein toll-like [Copidosoma floridanum]
MRELVGLLLLVCLSAEPSRARFTCPPQTPGCSCTEFDRNDFRVHCTAASPHDLAIRPGEYVGIKCGSGHQWAHFLNGNRLKVGFAETLTLSECRPIDARAYRMILSRLGLRLGRSIRAIRYENLGAPLHPGDLDFFPNLRSLELAENSLAGVRVDLLRGLSGLRYIGLRSTGLHPPAGFFSRSRSLETIELGFNGIDKLEPGAFDGAYSVLQINLWMNKLSNLDPLVFRNLSSLRVLDLSNNQLKNLPVDVFADLRNLQLLNLKRNALTELPKGLFRKNPNLHTIELSYNRRKLARLPDALLANLQFLKVARLGSLGLEHLPGNLAWNSVKLEELDLSWNHLSGLPALLLKDAAALKKLLLSGNDITAIPDGFFQRTKHLEVLDLSGNRLTSINESTLEGLRWLEELNLENNELTSIHPEAFADLENLKIARLGNNKLTMHTDYIDVFGRVSPLRYSTGLRELHLARNNVSELFSDWIITFTQLRKLDLSNNAIAELRVEDLQFTSDKLRVDLSSNNISKVDLSRLESMATPMDGQPRDVTVQLQGNPFECDCDVYPLLRYLSNDNHVKLELKGAQCSGPGYISGADLDQLDAEAFICKPTSNESYWSVDDNSDPCGPEGACECWLRPAGEMLVMNCSDRRMSHAPERIVLHGAKSVALDLSRNHLTEAPDMADPGYDRVVYLLLSDNRIHSVKDTLISSKLQYLALDGNNLMHLELGVLDLIASNESSIAELVMHDNPWSCDCNAGPLLDFVQSHAKDLPSLLDVRCADNATRLLDLSRVQLCPSSFPIEFFLSVMVFFGVSCFLLGLGRLLYVRCWKRVKVLLYSRGLCLCLVTEEELDHDRPYDAFISYSHKDEGFVKDKLLANLEAGPAPYKCQIHERDWLAGEWIPKQIERSVEQSRRTIIVLSRSFVRSEWSKFEFHVAHARAVEEGRIVRLIVVLLDDLSAEELDKLNPEIAEYIKMHTYIKWGDPWFWHNLYYALPHRGRRPRRDDCSDVGSTDHKGDTRV